MNLHSNWIKLVFNFYKIVKQFDFKLNENGVTKEPISLKLILSLKLKINKLINLKSN